MSYTAPMTPMQQRAALGVFLALVAGLGAWGLARTRREPDSTAWWRDRAGRGGLESACAGLGGAA